MEKRRILLVDPNEMVRLFFKDVFWLHGLDNKFTLDFAESIETAKKIILDPDRHPDIIFLDLVMPVEQEGRKATSSEAGFSFLRDLKGTPGNAKIRVIIFSSEKNATLEARAKELGATVYLEKGANLPQDLVALADTL